MTHTAEERLTKRHLESIEKMKKKHFKQDQRELFGNFQVVEEKSGNNSGGSDATISGNNLDWLEASGDGAIWDIFRRQDVLKLQEYLKKHFREFRHIHCCPLQQVIVSQFQLDTKFSFCCLTIIIILSVYNSGDKLLKEYYILLVNQCDTAGAPVLLLIQTTLWNGITKVSGKVVLVIKK